jgi:hypothetical protein
MATKRVKSYRWTGLPRKIFSAGFCAGFQAFASNQMKLRDMTRTEEMEFMAEQAKRRITAYSIHNGKIKVGRERK